MTILPGKRYWPEDFWHRLLVSSAPRSRRRMIAATLALVGLIGLADFLTGVEASLAVFYFLPVSLAVIAVGWRFAVGVAFASVAVWIGGDWIAGAHFRSPLIPAWNALIALGTYLVLIWLLASVLALRREIEDRVRDRTADLRAEIAERERLEKVVLEISERERRTIGRDLHDGLSQHLTGISLVAQAVTRQLAARGAPETADLEAIVSLVQQGIEQTRGLAKGLLLAEIERDSLLVAMEEFAATISAQFRVDCRVVSTGQIDLEENGIATHLYRIAQEAVRNAIRHGHARRITLSLNAREGGLELQIRDDGKGMPPPGGRGHGLGLRIMAHRAAIIGARIEMEAGPDCGTLVTCLLPIPTPPP